MLLNLGLNRLAPSLDPSLRKAPNIVAAPKSNVDVNAVLGLAPSQYEGLQSVGDTGYFYGDNKMYEPYTITRSAPSYYGLMYGMGGGSNRAEGTIEVDNQAFRPVDVDITGFSKSKADGSEIYNYDPSMAYVLSQTPRSIPAPTPNVTSFLSTPTANNYVGTYGAGRYLGDNGLLGFDFGLPSGQSANE